MPALLAAGTRFLVASAILAAVLVALRRPLRITRQEFLGTAIVGTMLLAVGVGLVHIVEQHIDSSVAAMIAGSVPLQVVLWRTLAGDRVNKGTLAAAVVGLAGLALIVVPGGLGGSSKAWALVLMLLATMSWSGGSFISQRLTLPRDPFLATVYEMFVGGLLATAAATGLGQWHEVTRETLQPGPVAAWAYLAVFGSVVGFTAYAWLLQVAPISQVVTHQYVNPLVAIVLGAAVLGERPTALTAVGAVLIVGAVIVTVSRETRATRSAASREPGREVSQGQTEACP